MFEKALKGNRAYWIWVAVLVLLAGAGVHGYRVQGAEGLASTGMGVGAVWGIYNAQLPFLAGLAASALFILVPERLMKQTGLSAAAPLSAFLAAVASAMSLLFLAAGFGMPSRIPTLFVNLSPSAPVSWYAPALLLYLLLSLGAGWSLLGARRKGTTPPRWLRALVVVAVPVGLALPVIAAFMLAVMPTHGLWTSAMLAPRILVSGLAAGMGLLLVMVVAMRRSAGAEEGRELAGRLSGYTAMAGLASLCFVGLDAGTAFLGNLPSETYALRLLYSDMAREALPVAYVPFAGLPSVLLASGAVSVLLLFLPAVRRGNLLPALAGLLIAVSAWFDRGPGLILAGQATPGGGEVYAPALPDMLVTIGIWAGGALLLTALLKVTLSVRRERGMA
ncbi:NrfD/PsrC family molybdoenzyme membrane anchor subunit [Chlorobium sp. N1]|uniref:NrfD/PsrC family molybdoenzyme membrane anchor subunit n=1 Tax=Chlorobium sp. N1 TaxID=2491138 RepID=UPI0010388A5D|nr:NrfD/PsrC family molybdoenzyme membrane anchor subunit [Chlorobium sp. N1]TCD48240.1 menaquinol oxidoreductase [Chlorobium sp. N1]